MNELDSDEKILKIWAHNFENQKSYSDKKIRKARSQLTFNPRQIHELLILLKSEGGYLLPRRARSLMGTPPEMCQTQKTPEMNVSDRDKKSLKIWAHNFEKQKS